MMEEAYHSMINTAIEADWDKWSEIKMCEGRAISCALNFLFISNIEHLLWMHSHLFFFVFVFLLVLFLFVWALFQLLTIDKKKVTGITFPLRWEKNMTFILIIALPLFIVFSVFLLLLLFYSHVSCQRALVISFYYTALRDAHQPPSFGFREQFALLSPFYLHLVSLQQLRLYFPSFYLLCAFFYDASALYSHRDVNRQCFTIGLDWYRFRTQMAVDVVDVSLLQTPSYTLSSVLPSK